MTDSKWKTMGLDENDMMSSHVIITSKKKKRCRLGNHSQHSMRHLTRDKFVRWQRLVAKCKNSDEEMMTRASRSFCKPFSDLHLIPTSSLPAKETFFAKSDTWQSEHAHVYDCFTCCQSENSEVLLKSL